MRNLHCRVYCRHVSRLCVYDWWISNGYKIWFMDGKKFIKTSPEWHDLLDFIGKDWQFGCPSGQHAEQHPSLISLVFRLIGNCSDQSVPIRVIGSGYLDGPCLSLGLR